MVGYFQNPMMPTGGGDPRKKEAMAAFNKLTAALKEITSGSQYVYLVELKKVCVALLAADEWGTPVAEEILYQIEAFARVGKLPPEAVQEASQRAQRRGSKGFVEELRARTPGEVRLDLQPLHWIATARPDLIEGLQPHVQVLSDHVFALLQSTKRTIAQLSSQANP